MVMTAVSAGLFGLPRRVIKSFYVAELSLFDIFCWAARGLVSPNIGEMENHKRPSRKLGSKGSRCMPGKKPPEQSQFFDVAVRWGMVDRSFFHLSQGVFFMGPKPFYLLKTRSLPAKVLALSWGPSQPAP